MNDLAVMHQQGKEANEQARAARKEQQDKLHENLKEERAAQVKLAEERSAQVEQTKPTPTPDEILAAMAGKNVDIKEPNGAPPQYLNEAERARAEADKKTAEAKKQEVKKQPPPATPPKN